MNPNIGKKAVGKCIIYTGKGRSGNGYGSMWVGNENKYAHRLAYERVHGPIPDGLCVLHHCDNRLCINPKHLWLGTQKDKTHDAMAKGRLVSDAKARSAQTRRTPEFRLKRRTYWTNK
jgi:hypothetical protein